MAAVTKTWGGQALPLDKGSLRTNVIFNTVKNCDALVFSTVSGMIGHGVFNEIAVATNSGIDVYQLEGNVCYKMKSVNLKDIIFQGNNRVYALLHMPVAYQEKMEW